MHQVVGDALEDLEALRGELALRIGRIGLGGGDILGDPCGIGTAGDDVQVANQVVDEADAQLGSEHLAAELALVGQHALLLEGVAVTAVVGVAGVGVVVGTEGEGGDVDGVRAGVDAGALELGLAFLGHLGLDAGEGVVLRLAQELGDGEAADVLLLIGSEDALVREGLAGGFAHAGLVELVGEGFDLTGQGLTLRGILAGIELAHLRVEFGGNLIRVSHG